MSDEIDCRGLLGEALDWFEKNPDRWTTGSYVVTADGQRKGLRAESYDPDTDRYCLVGKMCFIEADRRGLFPAEVVDEIEGCARTLLGWEIVNINDTVGSVGALEARIRPLLAVDNFLESC